MTPWAAAFSSMSASNCDVRPPPVVALVVLNGARFVDRVCLDDGRRILHAVRQHEIAGAVARHIDLRVRHGRNRGGPAAARRARPGGYTSDASSSAERKSTFCSDPPRRVASAMPFTSQRLTGIGARRVSRNSSPGFSSVTPVSARGQASDGREWDAVRTRMVGSDRDGYRGPRDGNAGFQLAEDDVDSAIVQRRGQTQSLGWRRDPRNPRPVLRDPRIRVPLSDQLSPGQGDFEDLGQRRAARRFSSRPSAGLGEVRPAAAASADDRRQLLDEPARPGRGRSGPSRPTRPAPPCPRARRRGRRRRCPRRSRSESERPRSAPFSMPSTRRVTSFTPTLAGVVRRRPPRCRDPPPPSATFIFS